MKSIILILSIIGFFNAKTAIDSEKFEVRIYNDSNYEIENYEIDVDGIITQFSNIEPHEYSEVKKMDNFREVDFPNMTVSKKRFLRKNLRTDKIIYSLGITCCFSECNTESGKYLISLKITKAKNNFVNVETNYIKE